MAAERVETHNGGLLIVALQERRRDQEFVPDVEARNQSHRQNTGIDKRQEHIVEDLPTISAVDDGRFLEFLWDREKVSAQQKDGEWAEDELLIRISEDVKRTPHQVGRGLPQLLG